MPLDIEVTQFPNGVGTAKDNSILNAVPQPLPNAFHHVEDFGPNTQVADWTDLAIGAGVGGDVFPDSANGVLQQVSAGAATDGNKLSLQLDGGNNFLISTAGRAWFGIRFRTDDPVENILVFGFSLAADTVAPGDGVFLRCADGSGVMEIVSVNSGAAESAADLGTLEADTWYEAALYWDGIDKVSGQFVGPDGVVGGGGNIIPGANLPSAGLTPGFLFSAGEAAAKTLDVDYVLFGGSR